MKELSGLQKKFILRWGELAARWGLNRTVAQLYALLYVSPEPLPADEIVRSLNVARSNVSSSLRELQNWGVIRTVHLLGDRRDHFACLPDAWEMFRIIVEERRRREIEPALGLLRECAAEAAHEKGDVTRRRLVQLLEIFETADSFYEKVRGLPTRLVLQMFRQVDRILKLFGGGK